MARLFRVILPVKNIERAAAFYSAVLGQPGKRVSPGRHYFDCGGTILACYDPLSDGDDFGQGWSYHDNQYLYFAVKDLETTYGSVCEAGGSIQEDIALMPWGERLFYAQDPLGNPICFVDDDTVFTG